MYNQVKMRNTIFYWQAEIFLSIEVFITDGYSFVYKHNVTVIQNPKKREAIGQLKVLSILIADIIF